MLNLVVIRSPDIEASAQFFAEFGLSFAKHSHGKGPMHYASEEAGVVFEIYPQVEGQETTAMTRLGFSVEALDAVMARLESLGAKVISAPADSPWGRRAVIQEPFGHKIEISQK
jgi:predicted enzyme related to lactoylglutathione lyase